MIPFNNLKAQYYSAKTEIDKALSDVLESGMFAGSRIREFEDAFKTSVHTKRCISVGNGTDALFISLKMLGIKPGDEVITPAFSWISSAETISLCGAKPIFADVDPQTYTVDPLEIEKKITSKTKAVIAVHLYGQAANVSELERLCKKNNLFLIEDCAQAHFTEIQGKHAGTFGDVGAFSFYPTKNLGAYGDAGCIITNNELLADRIKRFANHGAYEKDDHTMEGVNSRMDSIQAAVLLAKLPYVREWNKKRIENARQYSHLLKGVTEITVPFVQPDTTHTFHLYVVQAKDRNRLKQFLEDHGVQTHIHYPKALPMLLPYSHYNPAAGEFPVACHLQETVLSLPIYPELKTEEIIYICERIKEFYKT